MTPGTLSREFRGRWEARGATWNAFAGKPWQVGGGKRHLEHFRGNSVAGGRRGDATWNTFAGIPWQVGGGEMLPGTLSREFRGRWSARKATWNAFAGKPWQVGGGKRHLKRFCRDSVPGGKRDETPGTLLRGYRGRWAAGKATWNDFAGIPWQVGGEKGYLERFRGDTVAGGQRDETPETLLQGFRARWAAGWDTWHSHSKSKITVSVTESLTAGSQILFQKVCLR